jgi:LCP family protein required for cell wall assembly
MANVTDEHLLPVQDEEEPAPVRRRRRRRGRRVLVGALALLLTVVLAVGGGAWLAVERVTGDIERIPQVFDPIPEEQRPEKPAAEAPGAEGMTFLLAGLDRRSDVPTTGTDAQTPAWRPGAARTDAILVAHVTGDRSKAYLVSIPRDTYVEIPGRGMNKINAAYSFGGPTLLVQTVEQLTDLRIDHLAVIDWHGFRNLTDALGGVTLTFAEETVGRGRTWPAGTHTLSGAEALDYVGERYALPNGDFDRVERQQNWVRGVMRQLLSREALTDLGTLTAVADAVAQTTSVDDSLSGPGMAALAFEMRGIRSDDVTFLTVPTLGVGRAGAASIVRYDPQGAAQMWDAVKRDALDEWLAAHPGAVLDETVN